jgi:hypothetical protein
MDTVDSSGAAVASTANGMVNGAPKPPLAAPAPLVERLRALALSGLARMYQPEERLFVFRLRQMRSGVAAEGLSRRYSAISLIGLAGEDESAVVSVLGRHGLHDVCGRLMADVSRVDNLGDVALTLWAARAVHYSDRRGAWERLLELHPADRPYPVVELAWALAALCVDETAPAGDLRHRLARRLIASCHPRSGLFPHGGGVAARGMGVHVSCFADLVYPIHALALHAGCSGDHEALDAATRCARELHRRQGPAGQWWWHYDRRTGRVVERYPVYAVHQDAMAPLAFSALEAAGGPRLRDGILRGLEWLERAPELSGSSLIDESAGVIWRKVARREPGKLARYVQAAASRVHPALRVPGLDLVLPPRVIDYEDRPYHLGWLLHAWPPGRAMGWATKAAAP